MPPGITQMSWNTRSHKNHPTRNCLEQPHSLLPEIQETKSSFRSWMDKQTVEMPKNGILFTNKKERNYGYKLTMCINLKSIMLTGSGQNKRPHTIWFQLYRILEKADQEWPRCKCRTAKDHEGTSWYDRNILYYDCGWWWSQNCLHLSALMEWYT